jgi:hypothetical protein
MAGGGGNLSQLGRGFLRPVFYLGNNRISQVGVMLTTASTITLMTFYTTEFFGVRISPYTGIIAFLILPAIFVVGLLLIPLGIWIRFHQEKLAGRLPTEYPQIDLADPKLRETILFVAVMTGVNLAIFLTASYRGIHYMDSVQFCGQTCHSVMEPEYIAYVRSPHARVACVECHIGPGASWFARSKLSGAYQVVSVNLNLYSRPIPTPIENLRPSRETCEQCHWPLKFHGDKLVVNTRFAEDQENTETKTVLLMHTGGIDPLTQEPQGNHGVHLQPGAVIQYYPADEARQEIPYVWYQRADGEVIEYISEIAEQPLEELQAQPRRIMDCMDCHNRPTHTFQLPAPALDQALAARRIDPALPYIKQKGMELLQAEYGSQDGATAQIPASLRSFYQENYAEVSNGPGSAVDEAAAVLAGIYRSNVFPSMSISWGTYSNNLGHEAFPGCFRCHDGLHSSPDGEHTIISDCDTCHSLLAMEESDPEILKTLAGE